ncbi:MAG TPA: 4a-hydroxytetrahydrobiopterin dehydratase [Armatimonadota bacterium]|nr:4a-hydroxytetrahydrobiopterin dehydratase [Armatimonadota bacterium]
MALHEEKCEACTVGTPPLGPDEARDLSAQVPEWTLHEKSLERTFTFKDFRGSIAFINRVADIAEAQGHHPDIFISYNTVKLDLSTHKIGGLSRNDFILAAKIDELMKE